MTPDLTYLTLSATLTAALSLPYVLDRLLVRGISEAVGYPENPKPQSKWAQRLVKAHANAVENLVIFAALVLVAHVAGKVTSTVETACMIYFWARVVHAPAYALAIPLVRTFAFIACYVAQFMIAAQLLMN